MYKEKPGQMTVRAIFLLAVGAVQHLAVLCHGLNQILDDDVLHNIITSKIELKKFRLVADAGEHFAVGLHGLGQILDDRILHNYSYLQN